MAQGRSGRGEFQGSSVVIRELFRRGYRTLIPFLYSRSRYKLFLNTTLENIDLRVQALASATDYFSVFVRPIPIKAPFGASVLIVAPHQDDEIIGCGGALALQVRSGKKASIVILQDGADGHEELGTTREAQRDMRNEESRQAAALLELDPPRFLNHARLAESVPQAVEELKKLLTEQKIDAVFTPFVLDGHPDHRTANYILAAALNSVSWDVRILCYEVWGLLIPNVLVIIDDVIEKKLDMLRCFTFANKALDYVHTTKGLNMYRSRLLGAGECRYAECFFELPRQEFIELVDRVQASEKAASVGL
jgi:N-acetylglucosamine malate deacetylase 1